MLTSPVDDVHVSLVVDLPPERIDTPEVQRVERGVAGFVEAVGRVEEVEEDVSDLVDNLELELFLLEMRRLEEEGDGRGGDEGSASNARRRVEQTETEGILSRTSLV